MLPINIDIPRTASIAVGAAPHLMALRKQVITQLPKHPVQLLDKLVTYALAAWHAHLLALPVAEENALEGLLEEAALLREDLLIAAEALAHEKRVDGARVAEIRSGHGHLDTANDLVALAALFSEAWNHIENKTTVEWDDIERASRLGPELLVALGARNQPGLPVPRAADPADRRARAFTLFITAYDACARRSRICAGTSAMQISSRRRCSPGAAAARHPVREAAAIPMAAPILERLSPSRSRARADRRQNLHGFCHVRAGPRAPITSFPMLAGRSEGPDYIVPDARWPVRGPRLHRSRCSLAGPRARSTPLTVVTRRL